MHEQSRRDEQAANPAEERGETGDGERRKAETGPEASTRGGLPRQLPAFAKPLQTTQIAAVQVMPQKLHQERRRRAEEFQGNQCAVRAFFETERLAMVLAVGKSPRAEGPKTVTPFLGCRSTFGITFR